MGLWKLGIVYINLGFFVSHSLINMSVLIPFLSIGTGKIEAPRERNMSNAAG